MSDVEEILAKITLAFCIGVAVWSGIELYWEISPFIGGGI